MPIDVVMPQMGESIVEGTITKWLKKPGDSVEQDEPLFEISTDKVDAEIPSPAKGTLAEIKVPEGSTVQVDTVVATLNQEGEAAAAPAAKQEGKAPAASAPAQKPAQEEKQAPQPAGKAPSGGSSIDIVMPQMGESIVEGTITKWLKKVGDTVAKDEPLFEISTDKVDAEIPSPESGVLQEIKSDAGATVPINAVVGVLSGVAGAAGAAQPSAPPAPAAKPAAPAPPPASAPAPVAAQVAPESRTAGERVRSSPLVRRIAKENNVDLTRVPATGLGGRVTKEDIQGYLARGPQAAAPEARPSAQQAAPPVSTSAVSAAPAPSTAISAEDQLVPMSRMRSIIARRMVESKHTAAHVHSCFRIDMTRIARIREKEKAKYEQRNGVKLTYMPFISSAVIATLRKMPIVNASIEGESVRYHKNVNLGIAVALDWGLIVPVIRQAEEKNFLGIARAIADLASRARNKKLKPEETGSGTFTITNPGIFGELFGTPVINQPESAILGVGGLLKEPTVVTDEDGTDSISIRNVIHLTLGFDHRIIDGADAGKFMAELKKYLEEWNEDIG